MRKASLGTILLTVFLDLLGFGLVVPYLPGVARELGASSFTATLLGAAYSLMQLFFVPFWGHLSDRTGRRPIRSERWPQKGIDTRPIAAAQATPPSMVAREKPSVPTP